MLGTTDKEGEPGGWGGVLTCPQEAAERALGMRGCLGSPVWDPEQTMPAQRRNWVCWNHPVTLKGHGDPDQGLGTD